MSKHRGPRTRPRRILTIAGTTTGHAHTTRTPGATPPGGPDRLIDTEHELDRLCDQFEQRYTALLNTTITEQGWALQGVGADPCLPRHVYTIGLTAYDHPELVVVGLRTQPAAHLLNTLGEQVRAGTRLTSRHQCTDFPGWPRLALLDVDPGTSADLLTFANRRYQTPDGPPVDALQIVWCDPAGHFPWEPGWALPHDTQPILYYPLDPFAALDDEDEPDHAHPTAPGREHPGHDDGEDDTPRRHTTAG
ncbi:DUF4262 domain-containing protein [Pseudofrankia asymbiotica]|uniref:DUF4262 domain-containing protein n=1 Tax=Pseudofrankia asymbiotica TaxID=1834516 RepID=UPI0009D7393E|nr:DUF4262 domain-containing protein [Pseudofrankia asymbiotica]